MICPVCESEVKLDDTINGKNPPVIYKCIKCSWWERIDLMEKKDG